MLSPFISSELMADNIFLKKNVKKCFIPNIYRITFVFGTNPDAIKLFPLIIQLKKYKQLNVLLLILVNIRK